MASAVVGECEELVVEWIEQTTGESKGCLSTAEWLRSGQILCGLVNKIKPGLVKAARMITPRHKKENIKKFLKAVACDFGVPERSLFSPSDLYEEQNIGQVIACVFALADVVPRVAPQFQGPKLGSWSCRGEAPAVPSQCFTPYGANFSSMDAAAWSSIHRMFSKAKQSISPSGIEDLSTEAGSESGSESLVDEEMGVPSAGRRLLPSMGGFHGAGGLYGGVVLRGNPLTKMHHDDLSIGTAVPPADRCFLPSMGSFHGAAGCYGGVRLVGR